MKRASLARHAGFSLLEVLVAFTILVLALATLLQAFGTSTRAVDRSAEHSRAVLLAESKMASLGVEDPLREGETGGAFDEVYAWLVTVTPFEAGFGEGAPLAPFRVAVAVSWEGVRGPRSVTLETVMLEKP